MVIFMDSWMIQCFVHASSSSTSCLTDTEFLIKCLWTWFSTKELLESSHLVLATTLLQHGMTITSSLSCIHGVFGKYRIEHVCRVHLRAKAKLVIVDWKQRYGQRT